MLLLLLAALPRLAPAQEVVEVSYYLNDAQGTPVALMDEAGNVVARYEYEPYAAGRRSGGERTGLHGPRGGRGHGAGVHAAALLRPIDGSAKQQGLPNGRRLFECEPYALAVRG
jgi:hypothetical protein